MRVPATPRISRKEGKAWSFHSCGTGEFRYRYGEFRYKFSSKVEIANLLVGAQVTTVKMIQELRKRMDAQCEKFQEVFSRVSKHKDQPNKS